ncbi:MAG: tRNA (adenosine(37)-N6)-threonylcarbamoyltransferase complex dimerization subunit type 1 TsaB [Thermoguttaceae bacterium]|nr:tRNA (adenosine(37)-N6)-threonylcarbamoyltransferase complex dimerization subunit type 1 TsaB [Thermoguttaceae bacterium]
MNILAIETTGVTGSIAFLPESGSPLGRCLPQDQRSAESLLPAIEHLLAEGQIDRGAIDRIAVAVGPGSFTGLRVGVTCANILAWGLSCSGKKVDLVGVDTLQAMALGAAQRPLPNAPEGFVVSAGLDAQRREVTAREFLITPGAAIPLEPGFRLIGTEQWLCAPKERQVPDGRLFPLFLLGKAPARRPEIDGRFLPLPQVPLAVMVAKLGRDLPPSPRALRPVYSRLSAAEEKLAQKSARAES